MCQWFQDKIELSPNFLNDICFSDEAHFLLSGQVNSKYSIFWGTAAPNEVVQRPLHSKKCTAWVAMSKHGVIGPFWFENENWEPLTVIKERYVEVLQQYWTALGRRNRRSFKRDCQWFQQDRATRHTANMTLEWLDQRFPQRLVSRWRDPEWSPHSLGLNPADFFLWGYLKDHVYENNPKTLKQAITQNIRVITKQECIRAIDTFARRLQVCLQEKGGHLEHILQCAIDTVKIDVDV